MFHRLAGFPRLTYLVMLFSLFLFLSKANAQSCNNWLFLPSYQSYVRIGDLDVAGNKITVEATFMRTTPYTGGQIWAGDLVSKHNNPSDVNYLLRPNNAEITTTNGYFRTPDICEIELNKTYHVAMVYDGTTLKFYRNGFLMSSVPVTGNMYQNNFQTRIGLYDALVHNTNLIGYINEVRIWNVARSQSQINAYMATSLPNPATQPGLLAYYTFDNLLNKQGNPTWNGSLGGSAAIASTNPNCALNPLACKALDEVTPNFILPDTVCVNSPVNISNISLNATSSYWNFCVADPNANPVAVNLGNPGGSLALPVFTDIVSENGNYYVFVSNNWPGGLVRLDFGNSLLNTPTVVNLGNVGGIIPNTIEGIQIVRNEGRWYAIMVGGDILNGGIPSRVIKIDFGPNITNINPVGTNWGNIGNLAYPVDLHVFQENGIWYGFTVNAQNNTITRFNFSGSFNNVPTAVNLGNLGGLNFPTGIYAVKDNGNWHLFITNDVPNASLTRMDFDNSLLNNPTAVNLGNPGNVLYKTRDIYILKDCDKITALAVNADVDNLVKLDFNNDILSVPTGVTLGNLGNLDFPHSISKLFRVGNDLYSFITNVDNNTITRIRFQGCNSSSIPNSNLQSPPPITYSVPGVYNISLSVDEGLPTQATICKQVVVLPGLVHKPTQNFSICQGSSIKIGSSSPTGQYLWSNGAKTDSIVVNTSGIYWVETSRHGCVNRDSFNVAIANTLNLDLGPDKAVCFPASVTFDAGNPGATFLWSDGSTNQTITVNAAGVYYVRVTRDGCVTSDTVRVTPNSSTSFDFNYQQNACDPLSFQFYGIGVAPGNAYWDFGDGNSLSGNGSPVHRFASTGNYVIKYVAGNGTCSDTLRKTISVNFSLDNLILTSDTTICHGSGKQLRTIPSLSFCWSPTTYLDDPHSPIPTTTTTQDIVYYFTAEVTGINLITNGSFTSGNTGFTSEYVFTPNNVTEGEYFVGSNPPAWNSSLNICSDHTSVNGNMMMVNGAPIPNVNVWKQTIAVTPNTNYAFSTWIQALWPPNPAQLQFSINGKDVGQLITAPLPTCTWTQFYTTWNSGSSTTAAISIVNKNTQIQGNDFALDDISFAPVFVKRDSVVIKVEKPLVKSIADTLICAGSSVSLNAAGAQAYSWSPAAGLSNAGIPNPIASPVALTEYVVTGTTINGCIAKDTVKIDFHARPSYTLTGDTSICKNTTVQLSASGGQSYNWSPSTTLNNSSSSNPIASPMGNTKYYVDITDINTCVYRDSVDVNIRPDPLFTVTDAGAICQFDSTQLIATGGDVYSWQPAVGLSNPAIPNPKASPATTTDYIVTVSETTCNESKTLTARVTVKASPIINATKASDIDCRNAQTQLSANGAVQYSWSPVTGLNDAQIPNPFAAPPGTTQYIVTGTAANGCSAADTLEVNVHQKPKIVVSNDTMICKNGQVQLSVAGGERYSWTPVATLNNALIDKPVASPNVNTTYYVVVTDEINCDYLDSVHVALRPDPVFSVSNASQICKDGSMQLAASGGDSYSWQPASGLSDPSISNPVASPSSTTDYSVTITENICNQSSTLTTRLTILPSPTVNAQKSNDLDCSNDRSRLIATGANQYLWSPATTLNNSSVSDPVAMPQSTTDYIVEGIDASGCKGYDTITVKVDNVNKGGYLMPNAFTPNNDGLNDCYGIRYWGIIQDLEFSIYNRWGERIFFTQTPGQCWNGTYKGVKQDGGVYVYMIKAKTNCESEVFRKGTFVLVR